jgi:hypothetical protein
MLSDLDLYKICHGTYETGFQWDHLFQGSGDGDVYVGLKATGGYNVVAFRGSTTPEDWAKNFISVPAFESGLGWVDVGFADGLGEVVRNLLPFLSQGPWLLTGHSRGAAQALQFGARMALLGYRPQGVMVLAPPRTGRQGLKDIYRTIPVRAYCNKNDPVPMVPPWFEHPCDLIHIDQEPPKNDPWGPIAPHHSELYGQWIEKLDPMPQF